MLLSELDEYAGSPTKLHCVQAGRHGYAPIWFPANCSRALAYSQFVHGVVHRFIPMYGLEVVVVCEGKHCLYPPYFFYQIACWVHSRDAIWELLCGGSLAFMHAGWSVIHRNQAHLVGISVGGFKAG